MAPVTTSSSIRKKSKNLMMKYAKKTHLHQYSCRESLAIQEKPPELVLAADFTVLCTEKSDIWSLGATVLQLVLDTTVWDGDSFVKKFNARSSSQAIKSVWIPFKKKNNLVLDSISYRPWN